MKLNECCRERRLASVGIRTPLLVPSFSSKGFSNISQIHSALREHTPDASLVSAYDIGTGILNESGIYCSDVVFVDSGGYEIGKNEDLSEMYGQTSRSGTGWSAEAHEKAIQTLKPLTNVVLINYDESLPIRQQVEKAHQFFDKFSDHGSDFLMKPEPGTSYLNLEFLMSDPEEFSRFDIIGVTEKELGSSFVQRCSNILSMRRALHSHGLHTPIHIFGGLDPLSVLAYFLCGADVFDGLSWLRFAYRDGLAIYLNSFAIVNGRWADEMDVVHMLSCMQNLAHLTQLQAVMRRFTRNNRWDELEIPDDHLNQLISLIRVAGVDM